MYVCSDIIRILMHSHLICNNWVLYCEAIRTYLRTCGLVTPALLLSFIWQYNSALLGTYAPDSDTLDHAMHMHILHDMGHCSPLPWV